MSAIGCCCIMHKHQAAVPNAHQHYLAPLWLTSSMLCCRAQVREGVFGLLGRCNSCHCAAHPHAQLVRQATKPNVGSGGRGNPPDWSADQGVHLHRLGFCYAIQKVFLGSPVAAALLAWKGWRKLSCEICLENCSACLYNCVPELHSNVPPFLCACVLVPYIRLAVHRPSTLALQVFCVRTQDGLHRVAGCTPLKGARALVMHSPLKG